MTSWAISISIAVLLIWETQGLLICHISSSTTPIGYAEDLVYWLERTLSESLVYYRVLTVDSRLELENELVIGCDLVVDVTADEHISAMLGLLCKEESIVLVSLSSNSYLESSNRISARQSVYLDSMFTHFNWTSVSLLYSPNTQGFQLYADLREKYVVREVPIPENASKLSIQKILVREIKQFGFTVLCIASALSITGEVFSALQDEQMLKAGYAVIVAGEAAWKRQMESFEGLLLLREEDCVNARSLWQCEASLVAAFIINASIALNIPVGDLTRGAFICYLRSGIQGLMPSYVLLNTHNNTSHIVGRFDSAEKNMNKTGVIYYPGSVATLPSGVEGIIEISINSAPKTPQLRPPRA